MSRARAILCLATAMLVASAFLVVAQDRVDLAAATPDSGTRIPGEPLDAAAGIVEAALGAAALEPNPYNNIDGVPTFGAFARPKSH